MNLTVKTDKSRYERGSIRNAVSFALSSAASHAQQRFEHYSGILWKVREKIQTNIGKICRAVWRWHAWRWTGLFWLVRRRTRVEIVAWTLRNPFWSLCVKSREYHASVRAAILAASHFIQSDISLMKSRRRNATFEGSLHLMVGLNFISQSMLLQNQNSSVWNIVSIFKHPTTKWSQGGATRHIILKSRHTQIIYTLEKK